MALEDVQRMLERWGAYVSRVEMGGMGYPRRTVEGRLQAEGGVLSRTTGPMIPVVDDDPEAAWCERVVCRMRETHGDLADILRARYVEGRCGEILSRRMRMSERTTRERLRMAEHYILGAWNEKYQYAA